MASGYCLVLFYFGLKGFLQHFLQDRHSGNELSQLFIWECLTFTFERQFSSRYRIFGWFFSLSTLNVSTHCLLAFTVSSEKCASYFCHWPLVCSESLLSCWLQNLSLDLPFDYYALWCMFLWVHPVGICLKFLVFIFVFHQIWGFFLVIVSSDIFSASFFLFFWDAHNAYVVQVVGAWQVPLVLFTFHQFFFSVSQILSIHCHTW